MNDRQRIEHALVPALIMEYMLPLKGRTGIDEHLELMGEVIAVYLNKGSKEQNTKLRRRLKWDVLAIRNYMTSQKFDTRKGIFAMAQWGRELYKSGKVDIHFNEYNDFLNELGKTIQMGINNPDDEVDLEGVEMVFISAGRHVPKIHKVAQNLGYLKDVEIVLS